MAILAGYAAKNPAREGKAEEGHSEEGRAEKANREGGETRLHFPAHLFSHSEPSLLTPLPLFSEGPGLTVRGCD